MQVLFEITVQIKQKRGIGVENPSPSSFSGGLLIDLLTYLPSHVLTCLFTYYTTTIPWRVACPYQWTTPFPTVPLICLLTYVLTYVHTHSRTNLLTYSRTYYTTTIPWRVVCPYPWTTASANPKAALPCHPKQWLRCRLSRSRNPQRSARYSNFLSKVAIQLTFENFWIPEPHFLVIWSK